MDIRNFFFRYRGYLPIPIALILILQSNLTLSSVIKGSILIILGEALRIWAVRSAGGRTRTRKVGANTLCTWGPYAYVRNPLYIGNTIIYIGFILFADGKYIIPIFIIGILYIFTQYYSIIKLEEETLEKIFHEEYLDYKKNVPAFIPRLKQWKKITPSYYSWKNVLKAEKSTIFVIILLITVLLLKELIINTISNA
ncbi:MAG: isoprenylcysteine carboxylmethyltransferase family protein [Candidatus Marinimicrobia bacterium]|nr:isoprenylcysteine carboxylmethyltransferase family protein [Candidatus Neomarinimicrobiota bacterium]